MTKKRVWTQEESEILKNNKLLSAKEVQKLLPNRSLDAIYGRRRQLGVSESTKITPEMTEYIKEHYNSKTSKELACYCNVHRTTVERHMKSLGLTPLSKSDNWKVKDYNTSYENGEFVIDYLYEKVRR